MAVVEVLNGPGAGTVHALSAAETVLGRHGTCEIVLAAGKISRRHARILAEPNGYFLEDLQSRNGTFLNGQEVGARVRLRDEDLVELAETQLRFRLEEHERQELAAEPPPPSGEGPVGRPPGRVPTIVRAIDALDSVVAPENAAAKLKAMIEISRHLGSSLELDEVLPKILESVFRVFPQADRGYILLAKGPQGRLEPRAMKLRRDESGFPLTIQPISRTITEKVFKEGQAILSSDVQADERFQSSASVLDFEIRSMICAPLIGPSRRPLGILYVDTQDPDQQFDENDLDVLRGVATLAAQGVESARVHKELIDERRQSEETLRASEAQFRAVWDTATDAMRLTDEDGIVLAVNQAYCQLVGMKPSELEGRPFTTVYAEEEDAARMLQVYQDEFDARTRFRHREREFAFRSGKRLVVEVRNSFVEVEPGEFVLLSIFRDLTDRRRTEAALRESEGRFELVFQEARLGIAIGDADGRIAQVNPSLQRILGRSADKLTQRHIADLTHPENPAAGERVVSRLIEGERAEYRAEKPLNRTGDQTLWGHIVVSVVRDPAGQALHVIAMIEDISDRKRLEKEVADLAVAEQQRIGQELHDELGQVLTGLGYLCGSLITRLKNKQVAEVDQAQQLAEGLKRALTHVRSIARGLVPVEIDEEGLQAALGDMAARVEEIYGVRCTFTCPEPCRLSDSNTATHLYHIAQEAVTNAMKHGKAKAVEIELICTDGGIRLAVRDDGGGLPDGGAAPTGIGMRIMRYRAGIIGASFDVQSAPGEGTLVTCTLSAES